MPESNVKRLKPEEPPVVKVIATGIQITVGLTNDRQIAFSTGYEGDEDDEVVFERLSRNMRFADRLKAQYEIPEIEDQLAQMRKDRDDFAERIVVAEADVEHEKAIRQIEIDEMIASKEQAKAEFIAKIDGDLLKMQEHRAGVLNDAVAEHQRRGRQGSYVPAGAVKASLARIDEAVQKGKDAREAAIAGFEQEHADKVAEVQRNLERWLADKAQYIQNVQTSVARHDLLISDHELKLERRRQAAAG